MNINLHTHTARCGHAVGAEREYIERAIAGGFTDLGFSDHAPFVFPDGRTSRFRVPMHLAEDYMETLRRLREEYRDRIRIHIGFEMEYYPKYFGEMLKTVNDLGVEYLICGQHFLGSEYPGIHRYTGDTGHTREELPEMAETLLAALESGVFSYIAHPDVLNVIGEDEYYAECMRPVCRRAAELSIPLEINLLGIRENRAYPREYFWRVAGEEGCSVVYGSDAHSPETTVDAESLIRADEIVKKYHLKPVDRPTLIHPKTGVRTLL